MTHALQYSRQSNLLDIAMELLPCTESTSIILALASLLILYLILKVPRNLPPGPIGLPIVGYTPFIGKFAANDFENLGGKYGPLFSFYLGKRLVVVLNNYDVLREALINQSDIFSCRPYDLPFACGVEGSVFLNQEKWKHHRNLALKCLRNNQAGNSGQEQQIINEASCMMSEIKKVEGKPANLSYILRISVSNITCNIMFGTAYSHQDIEFLNFLKTFYKKFEFLGATSKWIYFPWLKYVPGFANLAGFKTLCEVEIHIMDFMKKHISAVKEANTRNENSLINAYLGEMEKNKEESNNTFNEKNLSVMLDILFGGGSATVNTWLLWAILYMMLYPDIQKKIHEEIDKNIGRDRIPQYNDRLRTPYTEATLMEVGRINTVVPFSLSHGNSKATTIYGYSIPKQSIIVPNIWQIHSDPLLWGDPQEFRPERFLSEQGQLQKPEFYIPFSIGKLNCLGEALGKMELYLFFVTMMQQFSFEAPPGDVIRNEGTMDIIYTPNEFKTIAKHRH